MSGSAQGKQVKARETSRDSAAMLAALSILAYAASMMTHEALGHGGYCLAAGGLTTMLTPWWESCRFPGVPQLGIKAAGPSVQCGAGLLAWLLLHRVFPDATRLRCFLWLYMTQSLLISSGYVAFTGIINAGDMAELVAPLHAPLLWRSVLILFGSAVYFLSLLAAAYELKRFASRNDGMQRLFRFVWIPYVSIGLFACCTAVSNQILGSGASGLAVASAGLNGRVGPMWLAVASSFGAGLGLFGLPSMQRGMTLKDFSPPLPLQWSIAWGIVAGIALIAFLFYIGPGLH